MEALHAFDQRHRSVRVDADDRTPEDYDANTEPTAECKGVYIKASIAADGGSYTLQIGEEGKPRTYQTR